MSLPGLNIDTQARDNAVAARKNRDGADLLLGVARGKHGAATDNPEADRSRRNAERAKAEGWGKTPGPRPNVPTPRP